MTTLPTRSGRTPLRALLEGAQAWGNLEVSDGRYGVARYRLTVYPPGLTREDRIALRLWRTFSIWGLGLWLLVEVSLMTVLAPWTAVAVTTVGCLIVGAAVLARAGRHRHGVRTLATALVTGAHDPHAVASHRMLCDLADRLRRADARFAAGELTAVEHEAQVWAVYDRIGG